MILEVHTKAGWMCLDATRATDTPARLMNHESDKTATTRPFKALLVDDAWRVSFTLTRNLVPGEFITWDCGVSPEGQEWLMRKNKPPTSTKSKPSSIFGDEDLGVLGWYTDQPRDNLTPDEKTSPTLSTDSEDSEMEVMGDEHADPVQEDYSDFILAESKEDTCFASDDKTVGEADKEEEEEEYDEEVCGGKSFLDVEAREDLPSTSWGSREVRPPPRYFPNSSDSEPEPSSRPPARKMKINIISSSDSETQHERRCELGRSSSSVEALPSRETPRSL